jgi:hypothetical protein
MRPRIGNHKPNPWIVPYFHLPDPEEDLEFRRELGIDNARLQFLNTPRLCQQPESPPHSVNYYRIMAEDAGQDGDAAVAAALAKERKNVPGPNLHQDATMTWYENRKDGKGEPRSHHQWNMSLFMIGFNLSEKEFLDIEERMTDLLMEDKIFSNPLSQFATIIRCHEIEEMVKNEFAEQLGKEGIPKWWFDFAIKGWVRHTALWMKKAKETLADKLQGKKMRVLRGGDKGFMRAKKVKAITKGNKEGNKNTQKEKQEKFEEAKKPAKRKYKPRAASVSKAYVEEGTDSEETEADNPAYVSELPPTKKSKKAPFVIDMLDELEDKDELPNAPASELIGTSESPTIVNQSNIPENQTVKVSESSSSPNLKIITSEQDTIAKRTDQEVLAAVTLPQQPQSIKSSPAPATKITRKTPPEDAPAAPKKRMGRPPKSRKAPELPKEKPAPKPKVPKAPKVAKAPKAPKASKPAKLAAQKVSSAPLLKNSHLLITVRHNASLRDCISVFSLVTSEIQAKINGEEDLDVKDLKWELLRTELKDGGLISEDGQHEDLVWVIDDLDMTVRNDKQLANAVRYLREKDKGGVSRGGMLRMEVVKTAIEVVDTEGSGGGSIGEKAVVQESQDAEVVVEEMAQDAVTNDPHENNTHRGINIEKSNIDGDGVEKAVDTKKGDIAADEVARAVVIKENSNVAAEGDSDDSQVITEDKKGNDDIYMLSGEKEEGGDAGDESELVVDNKHGANLPNSDILGENGGIIKISEVVTEQDAGTGDFDMAVSDVDNLGSLENTTEDANVRSF